jgi:RNA 2',3'-cyclic 3'-phosphodiesterase
MDETGVERLFFALWPDEASRNALHRAARAAGEKSAGRAIPRDNLHLTLLFLGAVAATRIAELGALLQPLDVPGFTLQIDRSGYWRHNRILWAAPSLIPPELRSIVAYLKCNARRMGFAVERRKYAPHITLVRDARPPGALPACSVTWRVSKFALVSSRSSAQGQRYETIGSGALSSSDVPRSKRHAS